MRRTTLRRTPLPPDRPKFCAFFPVFPQFSFFLLSLSWGLLVEFWWRLKRRGPERRGFTQQPENSKRAHLRVPELQKHHQISTRRPPRERAREKERKWVREREKKARNFGAPAFGPHPSDPHPWGLGPPPTLRAPIPPGSTLRPPSLRAEALQASTFSGFGPLRSSFLSCCSICSFVGHFELSFLFCFFFFFENLTAQPPRGLAPGGAVNAR